jgi:hypothetical protein
MDTYEAEGFFPEREILRARRLRAMVDVPLAPSEARARRFATWVMRWVVAVFTPIFVNAAGFGWISIRSSLEVLLGASLCVLLGTGALAAVELRTSFLRGNTPRPE